MFDVTVEAKQHIFQLLTKRHARLAELAPQAVISPERLILGGGVMKQAGLLERVRAHVQDLAGGYFDSASLRDDIDAYIVGPALGNRAGVLGAIELARLA